jgi:hypothetical protein
MRKSLFSFLAAGLIFCFFSQSAIAKNNSLRLQKDTIVAGEMVKAGSYTVRINDEGVLVLLKGSKLVVEALVDVAPLGGVNPNSLSIDKNGILEEIRFDENKVIFPTLSNAGRAAE